MYLYAFQSAIWQDAMKNQGSGKKHKLTHHLIIKPYMR